MVCLLIWSRSLRLAAVVWHHGGRSLRRPPVGFSVLPSTDLHACGGRAERTSDNCAEASSGDGTVTYRAVCRCIANMSGVCGGGKTRIAGNARPCLSPPLISKLFVVSQEPYTPTHGHQQAEISQARTKAASYKYWAGRDSAQLFSDKGPAQEAVRHASFLGAG